MTTVRRPSRLFSFTDWNKTRPKEPPPGDRLDAMFFELISAINSTQDALAEIRRDDGRLKNLSVNDEQLAPNLRAQLVGDINDKIAPIALTVAGTAASAREAARCAELYAKDAERAVKVAQELASGMVALRQLIEQRASVHVKSAADIDAFASDSENWANYSQAQADNAIAAKNEALQWAEFLAGPVVDAAQAPAYIAGTPFPHGLYYQPVEGGLAGLWSAKWWALFAQQIVGKTGMYYVGGWDSPPLPGEQNPNTGQVVPNPITPGTIYYNTSDSTLYVWDGDSWKKPISPVSAYTGHYVYQATTNQKVFSGPDLNGLTPDVINEVSDVFVNGVRLVPVSDYQIDNIANTLTLTDPVAASSMVQWDFLLPATMLAPGSVNAFKIHALTLDGTTQDFTLAYTSAGSTVNANVGDGAQLIVVLDGATQEPGADYTASGSNIHFAVAPLADAHLWIVWYQPGAPA